MEPFRDILISKARKKYDSNGFPIDLLLHYQKQTPALPWKEYFDDMVAKYTDEINAVLRANSGTSNCCGSSTSGGANCYSAWIAL
jgi:hypothetical protein